ncbi:hypothetical protein E8K88_13875 [Lampropedia aestuarii]|uniref:Uncharacterized protein n=1 Tax=Lampropedia aestuarii TaxID=2562762 RepID=A0A4S5BIF3_9BURK|nr:hypothetical protein [Lampropedia aestuarii]MDH5857246.1 hypothetical protein [Lampropedia aestuarii]THJ31909.1 hypothetical protein E8K88_13875 [Lampropedia aestuarii]
MIDITLSSGLTVTAQEAQIIFRCCLWDLLDGELVMNGWVWAANQCADGLNTPTYVPVRKANERELAIWSLLLATQSGHTKKLNHIT